MEQLLVRIAKQLNIDIAATSDLPQGMDSQVFVITDSRGHDYVVKVSDNDENEWRAYQLLTEQKVNIPLPKIHTSFQFNSQQVLVMERINFPLLENIATDQIASYIPAMIAVQKQIQLVKSPHAGLITEQSKKLNWQAVLLAPFTTTLDWQAIAQREGIDGELMLSSIKKFIDRANTFEFLTTNYSLLHTDFNQRNLFVDPHSDKITGIVDWSEAMFGDPIYDFARIRMLIWHFDLGSAVISKFYRLMNFTPVEYQLCELYWLARVIEYLAWYSQELTEFNTRRIALHQQFLRDYDWGL